ncbi:SDR family oxidoreductase [uncultured Litoreibacter sp.]|uniref:SDR family oxidoreductase n=1 Tax=uncultured Litoreibacter sp. TaxID=1392394 RepID=UPI00260F7838|nr:SDR family oxidoreductase [uncultured Litoreibacter sp.]
MTQPAALVTGAGDRLGRAMAVRLGEMGHHVAVHYASSAQGAEETVALIEAAGGKAVALQADLLDMDQAEKLVARASDALGGPLNVLINNASIFEHDTIETATRTSWDRAIGSNLQAPFILTQEFAKQAPRAVMDQRGEPKAQSCVINMLDQRVRKLTPEFMSYSIAKMGLWAFTQTAARGLAPHVRVNGIGPGPTLIGGRQSEEHFAAQRAATVSGRGSNPEDIVGAMQYILGAPALTGQLLCVDGGQHLGWKTPDVQGVE